jgi:hypothetical protein
MHRSRNKEEWYGKKRKGKGLRFLGLTEHHHKLRDLLSDGF